MLYGIDKSDLRKIKDMSLKNIWALIKTQMTRCIHCTRCIVATEVVGVNELGAIGREDMQITTYLKKL